MDPSLIQRLWLLSLNIFRNVETLVIHDIEIKQNHHLKRSHKRVQCNFNSESPHIWKGTLRISKRYNYTHIHKFINKNHRHYLACFGSQPLHILLTNFGRTDFRGSARFPSGGKAGFACCASWGASGWIDRRILRSLSGRTAPVFFFWKMGKQTGRNIYCLVKNMEMMEIWYMFRLRN